MCQREKHGWDLILEEEMMVVYLSSKQASDDMTGLRSQCLRVSISRDARLAYLDDALTSRPDLWIAFLVSFH
jgi:hypothetical protein